MARIFLAIPLPLFAIKPKRQRRDIPSLAYNLVLTPSFEFVDAVSSLVAPSPLPFTRGRGAGVRGLVSLAKRDIFAPTMPPHPRPLSPEYRGEGGTVPYAVI